MIKEVSPNSVKKANLDDSVWERLNTPKKRIKDVDFNARDEEEELKLCSFHPSISKTSQLINNAKPKTKYIKQKSRRQALQRCNRA